jgi:uncharacterized protein YkwD
MRRTIALMLALGVLVALAMSPGAGAAPLKRLLAPVAECPGATEADVAPVVQERAMQCLTDFARLGAGLGRLRDDSELDRSASHKARDILRCDSFSHYACGRDFTYWLQRVGYLHARCWRAGENIALGTGSLGSARSIFNQWLHSAVHRRNILGRFVQIGVGLKVGGFNGHPGMHVWTQHFGSHCRPIRPPAQLHADLGEQRALSG